MLDKMTSWTLKYIDAQIKKAQNRGDMKTALKLIDLKSWFIQKLKELGRYGPDSSN